MTALDFERGRRDAGAGRPDRAGGDRAGRRGRCCRVSRAPTEFRAIVNAHFACPAPKGLPLLTGMVGGASEWLFGFSDRLSVTISAAERFLATPREELAATIWGEVQEVAGFSAPLPAWQIIKEKRATFAATPQQDALRPGAATQWRNLVLAGDWTQTGLPATIEGAIRSGVRAAGLVAN